MAFYSISILFSRNDNNVCRTLGATKQDIDSRSLVRSLVRNSGLHNKRVRIYALYYELDVCFALTLCISKIPFLRFCITQSIK